MNELFKSCEKCGHLKYFCTCKNEYLLKAQIFKATKFEAAGSCGGEKGSTRFMIDDLSCPRRDIRDSFFRSIGYEDHLGRIRGLPPSSPLKDHTVGRDGYVSDMIGNASPFRVDSLGILRLRF